ncbi:MAG: HipA N-terminal domain-containing protein [Fidelibacterota bacterium]
MRRANVFVHGVPAGVLEEHERGRDYIFRYAEGYKGEPVSLTMPVDKHEYRFDRFPPFFEGLLPEGVMLEGLLRQGKIDRDDLFSQLVTVGQDLVGATTVVEAS